MSSPTSCIPWAASTRSCFSPGSHYSQAACPRHVFSLISRRFETLSQGESLSHYFSFFSHSHLSVFIYILLRRFTYLNIRVSQREGEKARVRNLPSPDTLSRWPQQVSWAKADVQCQQLLQGPTQLTPKLMAGLDWKWDVWDLSQCPQRMLGMLAS